MDSLICLLKDRQDVVEFLARGFKVLGEVIKTPDVGVRKQELFIATLNKLGVVEEPGEQLGRKVDFYLCIGEEKKAYSFKTAKDVEVVKVAWNGFPSKERVKRFKFKSPIVYVIEEGIYVFELDDIESVKKELNFNKFWWIPSNKTNPRGFGIKRGAVEKLVQKAVEKGNYIAFPKVSGEITRERYLDAFYEMVAKLADSLKTEHP
ncbi:MAG: hypothetical protein ABDH32_07390 [Candidatus Caldarchaeales archaeon]